LAAISGERPKQTGYNANKQEGSSAVLEKNVPGEKPNLNGQRNEFCNRNFGSISP
jgi:hypothetical protein